jgi:hypothetical protein
MGSRSTLRPACLPVRASGQRQRAGPRGSICPFRPQHCRFFSRAAFRRPSPVMSSQAPPVHAAAVHHSAAAMNPAAMSDGTAVDHRGDGRGTHVRSGARTRGAAKAGVEVIRPSRHAAPPPPPVASGGWARRVAGAAQSGCPCGLGESGGRPNVRSVRRPARLSAAGSDITSAQNLLINRRDLQDLLESYERVLLEGLE